MMLYFHAFIMPLLQLAGPGLWADCGETRGPCAGRPPPGFASPSICSERNKYQKTFQTMQHHWNQLRTVHMVRVHVHHSHKFPQLFEIHAQGASAHRLKRCLRSADRTPAVFLQKCWAIYFLTLRLEEWKTGSRGGKRWKNKGFPKSQAWAVSSLCTETTTKALPAGPGLCAQLY